MCNKDDYDMNEARERYSAMPPMPLIKSSRMNNDQEPTKRLLYSPAEVMDLIDHGYRGKMIVAEWMDGIAMNKTTIPVLMVQPAEEVEHAAELSEWEVAKMWMDMSNLALIERICEQIVKQGCEIAYES